MPAQKSDSDQESKETPEKDEAEKQQEVQQHEVEQQDVQQQDVQQQHPCSASTHSDPFIMQGVGAARALCLAPDGQLYAGAFDGSVTAICNPKPQSQTKLEKRETILKVPDRIFTVCMASCSLSAPSSLPSSQAGKGAETSPKLQPTKVLITGVADGAIYLSTIKPEAEPEPYAAPGAAPESEPESEPEPAAADRTAGAGARAADAATLQGNARNDACSPSSTRRCNRLVGHGTAAVRAIAIATSRKIFATAGVSGLLQWWQLPGGEPISGCKGHARDINDVVFSPSESWLASASSDGTVKIWEVASKEDGKGEGKGEEGSRGKKGRTGSAVPAAKPQAIFTGHRAIVVAVIAPNDSTVVSGGCDKCIRVWNKDTLVVSHVLRGHEANITSLAMPASTTAPTAPTTVFASGSMDKTVRVWSLPDGRNLSVLRAHTNFVYTIAFAPDGTTLASAGEGGNIRYWSVPEGSPLHTTNAAHGGNPIRALAAGSDGIILSGGFDNKLQAWDTASKKCIRSVENAHGGRLFAIAASSTGSGAAEETAVRDRQRTIVVSGAADGSVRMWDCLAGLFKDEDTDNGRGKAKGKDIDIDIEKDQTNVNEAAAAAAAAAAAEGPVGAAAAAAGTAAEESEEADEGQTPQRCVTTCQLSPVKNIVGHGPAAVRAVAVATKSNLFATAGVAGLLLWWQLPGGEPVGSCSGHSCDINGLVISPSESWLASAGSDGTVKIWGVPKPGMVPEYKPRAILRGHEAIVVAVIAPDDETVVSGSCDRSIRVWNQEEATVLRTMRGHEANVTSLAMLSDNVVLASGSMDKTVRLWDYEEGAALCVLEGHSSFVYNVIITTSAIFSAGEDGVFVWPADYVAALQLDHAEAMRAKREAQLREEEAERQRAVELAQRLKAEQEEAKQKIAKYQRRQSKLKEKKGDFKWTFPDAQSAEMSEVGIVAPTGPHASGAAASSGSGSDGGAGGNRTIVAMGGATATTAGKKMSVLQKLRLAVPGSSRRHANQPKPPTVRGITIINTAFDESIY